MQETKLQRLHREKLGLRVGPEMAKFIERKLADGDSSAIPVMGVDARTGAPKTRQLDATMLRAMTSN